MGFLLDTNVVSELRKTERCNSGVRRWVDDQASDDLYISVITIAEIRDGVERLRPKDSVQAAHLEQWLEEILAQFAERILPVTPKIAERWGRLRLSQPLPDFDRLIAATAVEHRLDLVTRNVRDFERSGVKLVNPWE